MASTGDNNEDMETDPVFVNGVLLENHHSECICGYCLPLLSIWLHATRCMIFMLLPLHDIHVAPAPATFMLLIYYFLLTPCLQCNLGPRQRKQRWSLPC